MARFKIPGAWDTDGRLPIGRHLCEVEKTDMLPGTGDKHDAILFKSRCIEGEHKKKVVLEYVSLVPQSQFRMLPYAIAAGLVDPNEVDASRWLEGSDQDTDDVLGARVYITIQEEPKMRRNAEGKLEDTGDKRLAVAKVEPA